MLKNNRSLLKENEKVVEEFKTSRCLLRSKDAEEIRILHHFTKWGNESKNGKWFPQVIAKLAGNLCSDDAR